MNALICLSDHLDFKSIFVYDENDGLRGLSFVSVSLQDKSVEMLSSEEELSQAQDEEDALTTSFENVRFSNYLHLLIRILKHLTDMRDETVIHYL